MTRLLTYPLAAVALLSGGVSLLAWGVLDPEPRRELYGSGREWLRSKIRRFNRP